LSQEEIIEAAKRSWSAGADFIKTSTGFSSGGATIEAVKIMRETVGDNLGVKASGGIRDRQTAEAMIAAGASRLGTSSGVAIVQNKTGSSSY
jgi:deoxyribose-phosphate aldolase